MYKGIFHNSHALFHQNAASLCSEFVSSQEEQARQIVKQYNQPFSAHHMWSVNPRDYIPMLSGRWMLLMSLPLGNTVSACLMLIPILSLCLCSQGRMQTIPYCSVHCCICHLGLSTASLNGKCSYLHVFCIKSICAQNKMVHNTSVSYNPQGQLL